MTRDNWRNGLIELRGSRSRKEVSSKLGITPQMLGAIERGDRNPSMDLSINIASYYKLTLDEFIFLLNKDTKCV